MHMTEIGQQPARFSPMRSPEVTRTIGDVERLIASGGFGWADRSEVQSAATRLASLAPQAADSVVDELARTGQLDRLAAEVMDTSWVGPGLTADQRADFMKAMAERLDGASLAALSNAFARTDPGTGGFAPVSELAHAVARHASPAARLEYVRELSGQTTDMPSHHVGGIAEFDGQRRLGDAEARAVAEVITSFSGDPALARAAFGALDRTPGAIDAVMAAAMDTEQDWGLLNGWHTESSDRSTFRDLMHTAANMERGHFSTPGESAARALGDEVFGAAARVIDPRDVDVADLVFRASPMDAHASLMAGIAAAVYSPAGAPAGATRVSDTELTAMGIDPALLHKPDIGFEAGLYALETGGYALAFRGTDDWSLATTGDTDDNLAQGLGLGSLQHSAASIAAMEVSHAIGTENMQVTGHSLGGGLAAAAAGRTGVQATTFNAAGIADASISGYSLAFADGQVTNYRTTGDILSFLNGGPLPTRYADWLKLDELGEFPASVGSNVDLGNPLARVYLDERLESWFSIGEGAAFGGQQHLMDEVLRHQRQ